MLYFDKALRIITFYKKLTSIINDSHLLIHFKIRNTLARIWPKYYYVFEPLYYDFHIAFDANAYAIY